jgi:hypothetical protein
MLLKDGEVLAELLSLQIGADGTNELLPKATLP